MDDNVTRILQMLQDGKISTEEAERLLAALQGKAPQATEPPPAEPASDKKPFGGFENIRPPKIDVDLDNLGARITAAINRVQPDRLARRIQTGLREATRVSVQLGNTFSQKVRAWTDGSDQRPTNPGALPQYENVSEQELAVGPGGFLQVENRLGSVSLAGNDDGPASITVRTTAWAGSYEDATAAAGRMTLTVHGTDTGVEIRAEAPDGYRDGTMDLELRIPRSAGARLATRFGGIIVNGINGRLECVSASGGVSTDDIGSDLRCETASGDIEAARIQGRASVGSQSGSVRLSAVHGGLSASTASGDISVTDAEGSALECKSVSGDVSVATVGRAAPVEMSLESVSGNLSLNAASGPLSLKSVSGDVSVVGTSTQRLQAHTVSGDASVVLADRFTGTMQFNSVSGDVAVTLPEGSSARVVLTTSSGSLRCEHDAASVTATGSMWSGSIGSGEGSVNVQTVSGDAAIHRAIEKPAAPAQPAADAGQPAAWPPRADAPAADAPAEPQPGWGFQPTPPAPATAADPAPPAQPAAPAADTEETDPGHGADA